MPTEEDLLSTPSNYATPKQIDAVREYAKALMTGSGQQPVKHWTQGVANLLQQLRGENLLWGSGNQEVASGREDAGKAALLHPESPASVAAALKGGDAPVARIPQRPGAGIGLPFSGEPSDPQAKASDPNNPMNWLGYEMDTPNGKVGGTFGAQPSPARRVQEGFNDVSLGFSGEPSSDGLPGVGSPAATAMALAAKPGLQPPGPNLGIASRVGDAPQGEALPASTLPNRLKVSRDQFVRTMASQYLPPEIKKAVAEAYYMQNQPLEQSATGGKLIVGADGKTRYVPDLQKGTAHLPGGLQMPLFQTIQPGPNGPVLKNIDEAPGAVAPTKPPAANLSNVPNLLKYADDSAKPPGMLGAALPPEITGGRSATPEEKVQTAQLPSYIDRMWQDSTKKDIEFEAAKEHAKKDVDAYDKKYDLFMSAGKQAQNALPQIELASRALENPNFYSGIGADLVVDWKRLMSQISKNPNAAAANEVFDKVISGNILGDLKAVLQGLGQVRVAEIDLLGKATANKYMSVPANRAVLDLMKRAHGQTDMISRITNAYGNGVRWNDKGEPYQTSERPTNAGLDKTVKTWMDAHPLVDKPTLENYTKLFEQDPAYKPKEADKRRKQIEAIRTGQSTSSTSTYGADMPTGYQLKKKAP